MENKRVYLWDNLKGILIFLVVLGHFLFSYNDTGMSRYIVGTIYMFHMPAFIFVSGYFSKKEHTRSKSVICKLLISYVIFNFLLMLTDILTGGIKSVSLLYPYNSMWYILALIVWRLTVKPVAKIPNILPISIIISLLLGFWSEFDNRLAICRIFVFLPFFLAGYKLKSQSFDKLVNMRKPLKYSLGAVLTGIAVFLSVYTVRCLLVPEEALVMTAYKSGYHVFYRIFIFAIATLFIAGLMLLLPNRKIPALATLGKNSFAVYLFHRPITIAFSHFFGADFYSEKYLIYALVGSVVVTAMFGNDKISGMINSWLEGISRVLCTQTSDKKQLKKKSRLTDAAVYLLIIILMINPFIKLVGLLNRDTNGESYGAMFTVMTADDKAMLENSLSLVFVGDLILLKNQVDDGFDAEKGEYNYDSVFKYAKSYFDEADYTVGIFEGPAAGEEKGYSTSNFNDNIPLYLNYPDEFAKAVKNSGIDLVSTANNHLLDMKLDGAMRTLDVLDAIGLEHTGSYRNQAEKNEIKLIKIGGLTCAVLAYTYGSNYFESSYFMDEQPYLTSLICAPSDKYFDECKRNVYSDFERAKVLNPDLIIAIPHMGTQFMHTTDVFQDTWNEIFIDAGADIVLGDHSHAVQPVEYRENGGRTSVIVNSPGNFANSYCKYDGDATAAVKIYIDSESAKINAAAVIPMYTYAPVGGQYCAAPVYKLINDTELSSSISKYELKRIEAVQKTVTKVMLGVEVPIDEAEKEYVLFKDGYRRGSVKPLENADVNKDSVMYKALASADSVCFIGDSVTEGTANGGYGWYEPLTAMLPKLTVYNCSKGGATTDTILERKDEFSSYRADVYVIAIGTNDVRYRESYDESTENDYISNIDKMVTAIRSQRSDAQIILISPWCALDSDPIIKISVQQRDKLLSAYSKALEAFAQSNGCDYIDVSSKIADIIKRTPSVYMVDHIHPNVSYGIALYSSKACE